MSHRTDAFMQQISTFLLPGLPILITGNYGCGKVEMTMRAIDRRQLHKHYIACAYFDSNLFMEVLTSYPSVLLLDDIDRLDKGMAKQVAYFLTTFTGLIAMVSVYPNRIHPAILASVVKRINVPDPTLEDMLEWAKGKQ